MPKQIQPIVQIRHASHLQPFNDPCQRDQRLVAQSLRHPHLGEITLLAPAQVVLFPSATPQLLLHHPLRLFRLALCTLRPEMILPQALVHLRQQLLPKRLIAQTPPPPY